MNATNAINAKRVFPWLPALFYMGLIFISSSQSNLPSLYEFRESDKLLHVLLYSPLGFLICYALSRSAPGVNLLYVGAFLTVLYGLTDELHQAFVPGRDASPLDLLADGVGAIIGSFIYTKSPFGRAASEPTSELT